MRTSTRCMDRRLAVGTLLPYTWRQEVCMMGVGRSRWVLQPDNFPRGGNRNGVCRHPPSFSPILLLRHLGQAGKLGVGLAGHFAGRGCSSSLSLQLETGSSKDRTTQRGRSPIAVHIRVGRVHLSGHKLGSGPGHCFLDWRAITSLMKPWCAEGDFRTRG